MGAFKIWLHAQETVLGSDGARDNAPAQTAKDTQVVANKWMSNPKNAPITSDLVTMGQSHRSALTQPLLKAGAQAVKFAGNFGKGVEAPAVAMNIQTNLGLPQVIKPPKPTQVKMMGRA